MNHANYRPKYLVVGVALEDDDALLLESLGGAFT